MCRIPERKKDMADDMEQLDRVYHFIMETFVKSGRGPHFIEIAKEFGLSPEGGKRLLRDLMNVKMPNWLYPNTDLIASFAPFNNLPTQYRITVGGRQKWFAQ